MSARTDAPGVPVWFLRAELRVLVGAWATVLLVTAPVRALVGAGAVWPVLWCLVACALLVLTRASGRSRLVLWCLVHAAGHLCWVVGQPGGWVGVPLAVGALLASVSVAVLARGLSAVLAAAVSVAALVLSVLRVVGGTA